ncbi:hypothetical protein ABZ070_10300 [Streptomyces sp. NPDC006283]|uniref:hypothetical protein n=1 Tax=Streptomyces sp. NPDC006283 TaxID=3156741 RepID=UPI0033BFADA3
MTVAYIPIDRTEVVSYLGSSWPPAATATFLRVPTEQGVTDGAVVIHEVEGQPGITWWLVDGIIPPQDAGPVDEALAALVPGSALETPAPQDEEPPGPPAGGFATSAPTP